MEGHSAFSVRETEDQAGMYVTENNSQHSEDTISKVFDSTCVTCL